MREGPGMLHTFKAVSKGTAFDTAESFKGNDESYCDKIGFDWKAFVVCVMEEA